MGHSELAERALLPVLPDEAAFPFSLRLHADTLASAGSSSMAAVCGGSLALADAGVPLKALVAGAAPRAGVLGRPALHAGRPGPGRAGCAGVAHREQRRPPTPVGLCTAQHPPARAPPAAAQA